MRLLNIIRWEDLPQNIGLLDIVCKMLKLFFVWCIIFILKHWKLNSIAKDSICWDIKVFTNILRIFYNRTFSVLLLWSTWKINFHQRGRNSISVWIRYKSFVFVVIKIKIKIECGIQFEITITFKFTLIFLILLF